MIDQYARTRLLIGDEGLNLLRQKRVAVFGVGGVGGHCCEALVRAGIGAIDVFDHDTVSLTNLNRQLVALHSTVGRSKIDVITERLHDVDPTVTVTAFDLFYMPENADSIDISAYDYVVDAIDTVIAKLELITRCTASKVPIISALGAGNKMDPSRLMITDISKTHTDPLAKVIRTECRKRGIGSLKVAFSDELPIKPPQEDVDGVRENQKRRAVPGSVPFVPSAMGILIASAVVHDLITAEVIGGRLLDEKREE